MEVIAAALDGFPETVTNLENLAVFRVLNVPGEGQWTGIVCHKCVQVLIDQVFQTGAVAIERDRAGTGSRDYSIKGRCNCCQDK